MFRTATAKPFCLTIVTVASSPRHDFDCNVRAAIHVPLFDQRQPLRPNVRHIWLGGAKVSDLESEAAAKYLTTDSACIHVSPQQMVDEFRDLVRSTHIGGGRMNHSIDQVRLLAVGDKLAEFVECDEVFGKIFGA